MWKLYIHVFFYHVCIILICRCTNICSLCCHNIFLNIGCVCFDIWIQGTFCILQTQEGVFWHKFTYFQSTKRKETESRSRTTLWCQVVLHTAGVAGDLTFFLISTVKHLYSLSTRRQDHSKENPPKNQHTVWASMNGEHIICQNQMRSWRKFLFFFVPLMLVYYFSILYWNIVLTSGHKY